MHSAQTSVKPNILKKNLRRESCISLRKHLVRDSPPFNLRRHHRTEGWLKQRTASRCALPRNLPCTSSTDDFRHNSYGRKTQHWSYYHYDPIRKGLKTFSQLPIEIFLAGIEAIMLSVYRGSKCLQPIDFFPLKAVKKTLNLRKEKDLPKTHDYHVSFLLEVSQDSIHYLVGFWKKYL